MVNNEEIARETEDGFHNDRCRSKDARERSHFRPDEQPNESKNNQRTDEDVKQIAYERQWICGDDSFVDNELVGEKYDGGKKPSRKQNGLLFRKTDVCDLEDADINEHQRQKGYRES